MEDYKIILYILLAVGYFLFSYFRKYFKEDHSQPKKFRAENEPPVQRSQQRPAVPVTSFEDILRELQPKAEKAKELERRATENTLTPVVTAETPYLSSYEHQTPEAVSLEQSLSKRPRVERQASFEPYAIKRTTTLRKFDPSVLRNPATARDAFILSEIFNRKY